MSKQPHQIVFAVVNAPKIGRKSGAKSRNGCLTCKARHIKCSEEKPACRRCTSSGKLCAGYAPRTADALTFGDGTLSSRSASPCSIKSDLSLTVDTAIGLPANPIDLRYLDHFRHRSAEALSRLGDQEFWSDLIPRLSVSRPTIQWAVLAVSAQHEAYLKGGIRGVTGGSPAAMYGLHHYSKAIAALNQTLTSTTATFDLLEVMVACVLFASFELLQGNGNGAMRHSRGGLQILSSRINKQRTNQVENSEELVAVLNSKPVKFLIRLDVDTVTYGGFQDAYPLAISAPDPLLSVQQSHETGSWSPKDDSSVFENIVRAREDLYSHLAFNYCFERNIAYPLQEHRHNFADTLDSVGCTSEQSFQIPDHILRWQESLLTNIRTWNSNLNALIQPLLSVSSKDSTVWAGGSKCKSKILREYATLHIACISSYMSIYTCLAAEEEAQELYDDLLDEFKNLLRSAEIIVLPGKDSPGTMQGDWEWSMVGNVIQPLAFTALKCRDHELRYRAISLLCMSGRRGGWDGQNLAQVVRCVVDYEERQAREEREMENMLCLEQDNQSKQGGVHEKHLGIPVCARVYRVELELDKAVDKASIWMSCPRDEAGFTCEVDLIKESEWEYSETIEEVSRDVGRMCPEWFV